MDDLPTKRIIALVDMDCFYCQVEARLNPELKGMPVVVVQYNQWKQGGIVAVSYEARARGVTRFMRGEEALKKCPELIIASIPCVRGKADLTKYRDAGAEVAAVFTMFSDCVQRASIDEAFIDLTDVVEKRIASESVELKPESFPSTYVIGYCDLKSNNEETRSEGTMAWLRKLQDSRYEQTADYRLAVGALIVEEMRAEVLKKTGFHCSAGIAHNKILAKLVAGLHKPQCQTVSPHESVPELYETLPIHKIRTLGGKMGKIVAEKLSISFMSELYKFSKEELTSTFDAKQGAWLYDIARGINYEPVSQRLIPDSIGCCKNFRGKMALKTPDEVMQWLREMAAEVAERLSKDLIENKRRAKSLTVSFKSEKSASRSCPLTSYEAMKIASDAFEVLKKFNKAPQNSLLWDPPLEHLGLSASKFVSGQTNTISQIFKAGEVVGTKTDITERLHTEDENVINDDSDSNATKAMTSIESEASDSKPAKRNKKRKQLALSEQTSAITKFFKTVESGKCKVSSGTKSDENQEWNGFRCKDGELRVSDSEVDENSRAPSSFFAKFLSTKKLEQVPETMEESSTDSETASAMPSNDFLAVAGPSTSNIAFAGTSSSSSPGLSGLNSFKSETEPMPSNDEFSETCPECSEKVHLDIYLDHLDYHVAMKLDKELNGKIMVRTVQVTQSPKKKSLPGKKQRKGSNLPPSNQHSIRSFFETMPKS